MNESPRSPKRRRSNDWPEDSRAQAHGQDKGKDEAKKYHEHTGSFGRRWRNRKNVSPRVTAAASNSNSKSPKSPAPRGRRSRFVEGTMNDSVSEKPPSIYLRDDLYAQQHQQYPQQQHLPHERGSGGASNHSHKSSGIFRFGKAIASAFNPFGAWGSVSGVWKGDSSGSGSGSGSASTDGNYNQRQEDDIARVHRAYEELKKSGFKGTVKGAYMQDVQSSNALPEQAWKSIQAKMDTNYKQPSTPGHHARQMSGESQDSTIGGSVRTSLDLRSSLDLRGALDLRKAKSSLGISSLVKQQESNTPEVRKQKSRKDLLRQAKLLKKVSNLEDKLERTRRELRELQGIQDKVPKIPKEYEQGHVQGQRREEKSSPQPQQQDEEPEQLHSQELVPLSASEQAMSLEQPYYPKKFVPGALSTLPSERSLENQAEAEDKKRVSANHTADAGAGAAGEPLQSLSTNITREANTTTPKKETKQQSSLCAATDSPSLKRKSPDPEFLEASKTLDPKRDNGSVPDKGTPPATTTPTRSNSTRSRRSKLQKMGKSDSPGSVERRKSQSSTPGSITRRKPRYLNPTSPRSSPSARRRSRSSSKSTSISPKKAQARLKTKKGFYDLASASATALPQTDKEIGMDMDVDSDADTDIMDYDMDSAQQRQNSFYMQGEQHLNPDHSANSTPTRTPSRKFCYDFEYIPPVPPLPKDLAATAAKVDQRLAKELNRRKSIGTTAVQHGAQQSHLQAKQQVEVQVPVKDDFEWPEDIF